MPTAIGSAPKKTKLGIDLGTTNSCAYFSRGGAIENVNIDGKHLLPSFVEYKSGKDPVVGYAAKKSVGKTKSSVVFNAKRLIGRYFNSEEVQKNLQNCGCPVENRDNTPSFYLESINSRVTPVDVATEILKKIIDEAKKRSECEISELCITIPANFDGNQRSATLRAAINCGFPEENITILNEPTAAALCYGYDNEVKDEYILVYDLGGGTFDVSIVKVSGGQYTVEVYEGNNNLGGADFDQLILEWISEKYKKLNGADLIPDSLPEAVKVRYKRRLLQVAEEAKIALAVTDTTDISVSNIIRVSKDKKDKKDISVSNITRVSKDNDDEEEENIPDFTLTLDQMNELIDKDIECTMDTVKSALKKAKLTKKDIGHVVLVGGSSRLKLVQEKLKSFFGTEKFSQATNPDECVAKGACLSLVNHIDMGEIIAYSLGQLLIDDKIQCIIPANTKLPATESVFNYTTSDNQDSVTTALYQGKQENTGDEADARRCIQLMPFSYRGFRRLPAGEVEFKTTFFIEKSGIVYVTVLETATGRTLLRKEKMEYK